jgi:PAS domain S-box-containing protein
MTHAVIDVNDKALEMIGAGRDIVVGSVCHQFICPAEPGKCPVTDMGQRVNCSDRILLNHQGEHIPIFKSVVRTTLRGKDVLIESFVDITERKKAENALRESERTIRNLLNAVPDDLALINHERTIIAVNASMAETLGQLPEALAGRAIGDFLTSSVLSETIDRIIDPHTMSGQVYFEEKRNDRWLETSVYPVTDRNSADVRIAIQSRDITDRKYLEEELKKAGLSQAALNIEKFQILNDQIRNPLQVIRGYLALGPAEYQGEINKQVEIIDNIVTELDMGWLESEKVQQFLIKHSHCSTRSFPEQHQEDGLQ